jgi:hypothetical protein
VTRYSVVLLDETSNTYASTAIVAQNDSEAKQIAANWANSLDERFEGAWLVLNDNGRGITVGPGRF